ncbi:MAG: DUF3592 domain-containing protein [Aulosira sp. ZfuVER01]|nr:DUF3592 domain-containing protein [Aulosira sp. ZfuVER01]MDZ8000469.1 DUF3592 domain-containing protein [Aulosira sp. DedVER01a]MDZ8052941.1 DUF3592 domain-containing protein [Aulosira sp. ZfuCHP01]
MFFIEFVLSSLLPVLPFTIIGLILTLISARSLWRSHRAKQWAESIGKIIDVKVEERSVKGRNRNLYQIVVSYEYVVNGKQHQSQQLFAGDSGVANSQALTEQRLRKYRPKADVNVYYNPHKPKESLIEREIDSTTYSLLAIGSVLVLVGLVFGLFIVFNELKDCGITLNSTHPRSGARPWCYR